MIERLAIVGVGLLGGSVAQAARRQGVARRIVGIGRSRERLTPAVADGTLDHATTDLAEGLASADFVVLAATVGAIAAMLPAVARAAGAEAVITDVGSTKRNIVRAAERTVADRGLLFVGSHPMAGSEKSGYAAAQPDLFRGATVVVTPTESTAPVAEKRVTGFWEALGARVVVLDPEAHDRAVAAVSHLPHLVAMALVEAVGRFEPAALDVAARGFRDTTRIAAADVAVWGEIFAANRDALAGSVAAFRRALDELQRLIESGDAAALGAALGRIKAAREALS